MPKINVERPGAGPKSEFNKLARSPEEQIAELTARLAAAEATIAGLHAKVEQLLNHTHELQLGFQKPAGMVGAHPDLLVATAMGPQLDHQRRTKPPAL